MNNQQAINLLKDLEKSLDDYCELNDEGKTAFGMAITALELFGNSEQLPSIQPERKTGHWIEMSSSNHTYKCSECGRLLVNVTDGKNNISKHYPYCHCGAKMEGGEQDE